MTQPVRQSFCDMVQSGMRGPAVAMMSAEVNVEIGPL